MPTATSRLFCARPPSSPPAVWAAFAAVGRWKSWLLLGQQVALVCLLGLCFQLTKLEPDVVLVGPEGEGQYVRRSVATAALLQFLAEQKSLPADVTVLAFTRRFLKSTLQVNSTTFAEDWAEALSLMAPPLRERLEKESVQQKLVEANQLLQVRTRLVFDDVLVMERRGSRIHVRALVQRERLRLLADGSAPVRDAVQVELVLSLTPRSPRRPDGLEVLDWRVGPRKEQEPTKVPGEGTR